MEVVILEELHDQKIGRRGGNRIVRYGLKSLSTGNLASYLDFLTHLQMDGGILITQLIQQYHPLPIFWECIPISRSLLYSHQPFEFVIIDAPEFLSIKADGSSFQQKFTRAHPTERIISFENLGRDAVLVAPCPFSEIDESFMINLQPFLCHAPMELSMELWKTVGEIVLRKLHEVEEDKLIWLSTSGLGVYWLHIRLDSKPKYYNWEAYKER